MRQANLAAMELVLASNNPHKVTEVRRILAGIAVRTPAELGISFAFEETGSTYEHNALGKARHLHGLIGMPTLADDSGLAVAALGGAPGVRSARFGPPGAALDDAGRCAYLLSLLGGAADRSAAFICCIAVVLDARRLLLVQDAVAGTDRAAAARRARVRLRSGVPGRRRRAHHGRADRCREGPPLAPRTGVAPYHRAAHLPDAGAVLKPGRTLSRRAAGW